MNNDEISNVRPNAAYLTLGASLVALVAVLLVLWRTDRNPRTDDASVRANYVQFAPEVSGRLISLGVKDNAYVHKGDLLFAIDSRQYEYALQQALADQSLLEAQIVDAQRRIRAEGSAVEAARAGVSGSKAHTLVSESSVHASRAAVERAKAAVESAEAQQKLAESNLHRIEPLLAKQYVTPEQVDEARTKAQVAEHNYLEAQAMLQHALAQQKQAEFTEQEAQVNVEASSAKLQQSIHAVEILDTLLAQRPAKAAKVDDAKLNLERCTVKAPFDGYVTNLNISEGEYAKPGMPIFTLIDARNWWVVANYRESELKSIRPGNHVDLYVMSNPTRKFDGIVESVGYGVMPDDTRLSNGLPQIEHTLNWVHIAARFPVRVRVQNPDPALFRIGETAISIVR
ncbi:MAG TPA: biotin/lipoyl-binding protein [candidate division Zixibacteria bacterium]|nr:biotin/lipoyl-binding protein [candidate division Zixibacteria bacterium]